MPTGDTENTIVWKSKILLDENIKFTPATGNSLTPNRNGFITKKWQ